MTCFTTDEKKEVCALYVDVTGDRILALNAEGFEVNEARFATMNVGEWLEMNIYPYIVTEAKEQEFREEFRRKNLLEQFELGNTRFEYQEGYRSFSIDGQLEVYHVEVNIFRNVNNGHVEASVIWKNRTIDYIDTEIRKILYQNDYSSLGLIDIEKGVVYFRTHQFGAMGPKLEESLSYKETMEKMEELWIAPVNQELFARCTDLDYIYDNLELAGRYSFQVYNVENKNERYTYYWFDREKKILLVVVDDMTKEMELDAVTGGLNREGFFHRTTELLKNHPDQKFAMLYMNMKRFRAVNDLYGYENGDMVLREALNKFQTSFLKPLVLARIEADRFAMIVDQKNLDFTRLPGLLYGMYEKDGVKVEIYGRCGIYYIPEHCTLSVSEMCDRAKLAKMSISNQYVQPYAIFNEEMNEDYEQRSIALIHLDEAIQKGEIKIFYQPVYDAWTHDIVAAEALARWHSKENGMILPGRFVPVLEESGHITKLDTFVHESVRKFQERRFAEKKPMVKLSMNLSRMDLMNPDIMQLIVEHVKTSPVPAYMLSYEVTESAYTVVSRKGMDFLTELRKMGVNLLMDDFGSGVSSFSTIRDYDFDVIKLDMGFVQKVGTSRKHNNILIALIDLAHHLDMKVIAEGVETKEQADFLKNYGCDYLQGYYFAKPMPEEEFEKLLDRKL